MKVVNGCVITSVLNTTEKEVNMLEPVVVVTELEEGERPKTAFSTKQGHWEYKRLPFGKKQRMQLFKN